jgi:O6-methylguanine-DNA--protein-cysteine methyltransferase
MVSLSSGYHQQVWLILRPILPGTAMLYSELATKLGMREYSAEYQGMETDENL